MLKKVKKILSIVTIATLCIPILMLILAIFGVEVFEGVLLKFLLTFATIAVACAFSINALNIFEKNKIISIVSISLLGLSALLGFIIYWSEFTMPALFNNLTMVLAIATVFFCIIVSTHLKLGKKYLVLQIITYCLVIIIDILLTLLIFGIEIFEVKGLSEIFWTICLVTFALICVTGVLGKKSNDNSESNKKYVKIPVEEYESLKARLAELEGQQKE